MLYVRLDERYFADRRFRNGSHGLYPLNIHNMLSCSGTNPWMFT